MTKPSYPHDFLPGLTMSTKKTSSIPETTASEPLFTRLILGPVLFVSFLVSLFLIDRQSYSRIFTRSGSEDGYYHSHQRKLAKREMDDAFQLRGKVIAAMCMAGALSLALFVWGVRSILTLWRVRP